MENRIGQKFLTNSSGYCEIIEYFSSTNITIIFEDKTIKKFVKYKNLQNGKVKNTSDNFYGIFFIGKGKYNSKNIAYKIWCNIIRRCYDINHQKIQPTYINCTVDERWYNFQVFAEWFEQNYINDYHLDKDILIKNNKVYGPDTCCFVPQEINKLFTKSNKIRGKYPIGVCFDDGKYQAQINKFSKKIFIGRYNTIEEAFKSYKFWKEEYIKDIANEFKNKISEKVYQALINYQVEITD